MNVDGSGLHRVSNGEGPHHLRLLLSGRPAHPLQLHFRGAHRSVPRRPTARRATSGHCTTSRSTPLEPTARHRAAHPQRCLRRRGHRFARRKAHGVHQHARRRHRALHHESGRHRSPPGDPPGRLRRRRLLLARRSHGWCGGRCIPKRRPTPPTTGACSASGWCGRPGWSSGWPTPTAATRVR